MNDLECARYVLIGGGCTLALVRGEEVHTSSERGVKPLLELLDAEKDVHDWSAADNVVGRAAAFLYVLLGVKAVYANVMSTLAEEVLCGHGIAVEAKTHTERIVNRAGTGYCPMETAVENISDPTEALQAIRAKIAEMMKR